MLNKNLGKKIKSLVKTHYLLLITFTMALFILFFSFKFDIFQYGDNCGYMILGQSLAEGKGFSNIALPEPIHFLWWPPGFPIFIALFYLILGPSWNILKMVIFILLYISFFLFAHLIKSNSKKSDLKSVMILLACCVSSGIHLLSSYLYSETFYIICSLFFFFIWSKWKDRLDLKKIFILSILAIYLSSVRLIGMSIALTLILYIGFFRKINIPRWYCLIPLLSLLIYISITLFVPPMQVDSFRATIGLHSQFSSEITGITGDESISISYIGSHLVTKAQGFLRGYGLTLIPQALIRSLYDLHEMNISKAIIMFLVTSIVVIGWLQTNNKYNFLNIYIILYMLILFFHGPLYVRLLVPIIPFLFLYFYSGWEYIFHIALKNNSKRYIFLVIIWLGVISDNAFLSVTEPHRTMPAQFGDQSYQQCIKWIINKAAPKEVVVSQVHTYLFLRRGKYCLPFIGFKTANEVISYFDRYRVQYVMVSPFYRRSRYTFMKHVKQAIHDYPERFKMVYRGTTGESYILEYYAE